MEQTTQNELLYLIKFANLIDGKKIIIDLYIKKIFNYLFYIFRSKYAKTWDLSKGELIQIALEGIIKSIYIYDITNNNCSFDQAIHTICKTYLLQSLFFGKSGINKTKLSFSLINNNDETNNNSILVNNKINVVSEISIRNKIYTKYIIQLFYKTVNSIKNKTQKTIYLLSANGWQISDIAVKLKLSYRNVTLIIRKFRYYFKKLVKQKLGIDVDELLINY